jgi:hypothetical protein
MSFAAGRFQASGANAATVDMQQKTAHPTGS